MQTTLILSAAVLGRDICGGWWPYVYHRPIPAPAFELPKLEPFNHERNGFFNRSVLLGRFITSGGDI